MFEQELERLSSSDRVRWQQVYDEAFSETQDEMMAALAAWGAVNRRLVLARLGRKSQSGGMLVEGWAMLFTNEGERDLDRQYFDQTTATLLDLYLSAPLWMEHGAEKDYGVHPIGKRVKAQVYRRGVYLWHELDPQHPRYAETLRGVENGEFSYSTDSIKHYAEQGYDPETGHLGVWFMAGCSLTRTPAEPGLGPVTSSEFIRAVKRAESREAKSVASSTGQPSKFSQHGEGILVYEQLIKQLALVFSVEAKPDAVKTALEGLAQNLDEEEGDAAGKAPDMAQLRAALGLGEDASVDEVRARLTAMLDMLNQPATTDGTMSAGKSIDYTALAEAAKTAAAHAPPVNTLPYHTQTQTQPGQKSLRHNVNVNRGAKKPGLADMVADLKAGKSASYQMGPLGGYIVRQDVRDEILPLLRSKLVFEKLGVRITPMPDYAALQIPKMSAAPQAYWVGTNTEVPEDEAEFQTMQLNPRQIAARTRIPLRMLNTMPAEAEQRVRDEIITSLRLKIEYSGLYGTGAVTGSNTGAEPLGLINHANVTKTTLATNGRAPTPKDMSDAKRRVEADNVELTETTHWLYHPNVLSYFEDLTDTNGRLLEASQWQKGFSPVTTTQVPTNLTTGSSSDTTDIFFGRWDYLEMGLGNQIELMVLNELYAANLQVGIIAYTYADFAVHYEQAFEAVRGVRV